MSDGWDWVGAAIDLATDIHDAWVEARDRRRAKETEGNES